MKNMTPFVFAGIPVCTLTPMVTIVYALAVGLITATSSLVSRRNGEKNREGASIAGVQAMQPSPCAFCGWPT